MIIVSGLITIDPASFERGVELTRELMARTREEPGNVSYEFFAALEDRSRFRVFEEWESQEAIDAHNASEHFAAFLAASADLGITSVEIIQYEVTSATRVM